MVFVGQEQVSNPAALQILRLTVLMLLHGPLLAGGDYKDTIRTSSGCFLQIRLQVVPKGNELMKGGIADNTERNEIRVAHTTENSHWSKSMCPPIKSDT